jgi:phage terminase large subunit-like protein
MATRPPKPKPPPEPPGATERSRTKEPPKSAPPLLPPGLDADLWKRWTPAAQQRALEALRAATRDEWRPFYCPNPVCDGKPHGDWDWAHARSDQRPPMDGDWVTWLLTGGRGSGKTRTGSEFTQRMTEYTGRLALVGPTGPDARDVMVEGESGILAIAAPGKVPAWEPSKRRLTWPNGAKGHVFSAEEPDRLRGPEHGYAWIDEPAHFPLVQQVWDNLMFGLRIGARPRVVATTTPKPRPWLKELIAARTTRVAKASTFDNLDNLAPTFAELIISRYQGTRLGRQELEGEILEDVEGALWHYEMIEVDRVERAPTMVRVVIAVDPAGTANRHSDETGIVAVGVDRSGDLYVLGDRSGRYSPAGWANAVDALADEHDADAIVAEKNFGGDLITANLRSAGIRRRILLVDSRRGKALRAEPIVGLYEQHKVHHVGRHSDLEEQMCSWAPYEDRDSPDRVDALVHGCTQLAGRNRTASVSTPRHALDELALRRAARAS